MEPWNLRRWLDPGYPIGRVSFGIVQWGGIVSDRALTRWMSSGATAIPLAAGLVIVFAIMGVTAARRLLAVGLSRAWALVMLGPALFELMLVVGRVNQQVFTKISQTAVSFAVLALYGGYGVMVVFLILKRGRRDICG